MRMHLLAAAACMTQPLAARSVVISDTTVIDPAMGTVTPHRTVVTDGDRIVAVQATSKRIPRDALKVDGRGKFLIPGLWDAHTHLSKTGEAGLRMFLANGVTGVRDMGSNLAEVRGWRDAISSGSLLGPRIKFSGPMLEAASNIARMRAQHGVENVDRQRVGFANPQEARAAVRRLASEGVDQIKMRTTPDVASFLAVADEARARKLPFAAHPQELKDILDARLTSVEHFLTYPPLTIGKAERKRLFRTMAARRMAVDNTLVVYEAVSRPYPLARRVLAHRDDPADPRRRYICGYLLKDWAEQAEEARQGGLGELRRYLPGWHRDFREMDAAGVSLLAGTDAAVLFDYPGFSLHDQLAQMVEKVGLAPMRVLRIATTGVPTYFGEQASTGRVAPRFAADLVLLDMNPVKSIRATRAIRGVMSQGEWHDKVALGALLEGVAKDAAGPCTLGSAAGTPGHGD